MNGLILLIITYFIIATVLITVVLNVISKYRKNTINATLLKLDKEKNLIGATPILNELSKVEPIIKNEKLEYKYNNWVEKFDNIKDVNITKINDMLIDIEMLSKTKNTKELNKKTAKVELEIYKTRNAVNKLLDEIKEITLSEDKYRSIVIKLKSKYRQLQTIFNEKKEDYSIVKEVIELQFENIEKRFLDFELVMEKNEYDDVVGIVKSLDSYICNMEIIIDETPDLLLMAMVLIPKRIEQLKEIYDDMLAKKYNLDYIKLDYNIKETTKNINIILDKIKVLNLDDCMFDLKTMLDYLDSIFNDFEKEKQAKKGYEESNKSFYKKINKINELVHDIDMQLDDIKNMYDLTNEDLDKMYAIKDTLLLINTEYKEMLDNVSSNNKPYSQILNDLEALSVKLSTLEEDLNISLKNLGSMYDDELRAKEQLEDIKNLLKECKEKIKSYKLPIINDKYFVELKEANDAILEIIKELENVPIVIKTLNIRVDNARDLVLKLYNTTNEMIKSAKMSEDLIVFGNRYIYMNESVDKGLSQAKVLFYKGEYRSALTMAINTLDLVEKGLYKKLLNIYDNK
ncbi:MAG: septation ring formation regulator EzrA [Bacilli bacterium]